MPPGGTSPPRCPRWPPARRAPQPPARFSTTHPKRYPVFGVPDDFVPPDLLGRTDLLLTTRFALAATRQALADAGWEPDALRRLRVGVCLGTTVGCALNIEDFYREYRRGGHPDLETIERFLRSNPAAAVSREFGLDGPVQTVVNACSSGTDAIGIAASWLRAGSATWCSPAARTSSAASSTTASSR